MRSGLQVLLAFWLAIQLLAGQQLALAHAVDHLGEASHGHGVATDPVAGEGDEAPDAPPELAHICTTCVGFLGFDAMSAGEAAAVFALVTWALVAVAAVPPAPTFAFPAAYRRRAPPAVPI